MTGPFGDDDMARWNSLDLDGRDLFDRAMLEVRTTGFDTALTGLPLQLVESAVTAFCAYHRHSLASVAIAQAWLATWHTAHPEEVHR